MDIHRPEPCSKNLFHEFVLNSYSMMEEIHLVVFALVHADLVGVEQSRVAVRICCEGRFLVRLPLR